jgi:hypothetical protein
MNEEMPYPDMKAIKKSIPRIKASRLFMINGKPFNCVLSQAEHYEFLTITSGYNKRPDWESVCKIKQEMFGDTVALSYHGKKGDALTKLTKDHGDTIIVMRPIDIPFPAPPAALVGIKGYSEMDLHNMADDEKQTLFDNAAKHIKEDLGYQK